MPNDVVLSMRGISKSFPGVRALHNVDFTLKQGEIHALMGENGAGKSTLIKVLTGVYPKDSGQVFLGDNNREITVKSPQEAQHLGISTVYQEITLCPNLSVAENMFIGRGNEKAVHWRAMQRRATELRERLELGALLVTRSEEGMSLFLPDRTIHEKAVAREVFDVSGAGDTVIATLAVMAAHGADWADAIHVANVAAGVVVGKLGTAVVTREELATALN